MGFLSLMGSSTENSPTCNRHCGDSSEPFGRYSHNLSSVVMFHSLKEVLGDEVLHVCHCGTQKHRPVRWL